MSDSRNVVRLLSPTDEPIEASAEIAVEGDLATIAFEAGTLKLTVGMPVSDARALASRILAALDDGEEPAR